MCNRINHVDPTPPVDQEEVEMDDLKKVQEAADPYEKRLKPISSDTPIQGGLPSWVIRHHGDQAEFTSANPLHPN